MHRNVSVARGVGRLAVIAGLALGLVVAFANGAMAQAKGLEGVWSIQVTLRNCESGAPIGPSFNSLVTFASGGTIVESTGALGFAAGQRSQGHGTWAHEGGATFSQRVVALILFTTPAGQGTPGFEAGWQTINHTVELVDADHVESSGSNAFYRTNGELYRSGCSTASGQRFK